MTAAVRLRRAWGLGDAGFSLAESVVALTILAIMTALAFTGPNLIANRRLAGDARVLGTDVRWVLQRAMTERRCWRISFDPPGEHYHIQYLAGGSWTAGGGCSGGTWTDYTAPAGRLLSRSIDLVSTSFASDIMTVTPYGDVTAGDVTLQRPGGEQRRVLINAIGRVLFTR
ncbi:MAG: pilus assembly FimT family protein [bacterium]